MEFHADQEESSYVAHPAQGNDSTHDTGRSEGAGKGLGVSLFAVLSVGFVFGFVLPPLSFVCYGAGLVLSFVLSCGCRRFQYKLTPAKKKFAAATLASLVMMFVVQIVSIIGAMAARGAGSTQGAIDAAAAGVTLAMYMSIALNLMAIAFSALFAWGRK